MAKSQRIRFLLVISALRSICCHVHNSPKVCCMCVTCHDVIGGSKFNLK